MIDFEKINDGRWHKADSLKSTEVRQWRYGRAAGGALVYRWAGHCMRHLGDNKWTGNRCPHFHTSEDVADRCAEKLARRLNKQEGR